MNRVIRSMVLFGLAVTLIAWAVISALPRPIVVQAPDTSGNEEPQEGALYENGWVVANYGNARIMDAYLRYQEFLGEPISGFDGRCQSFCFGRLCYRLGNPPDWQVEFANLGLEDMQVQGYTPKRGSIPHPALRDWLVTQLEAGVDTMRVVGGVVSDPVCDRKTGACRQWTDKQLFLFDGAAFSFHQVERAPLGLWLTHTKTRSVTVSSRQTASDLNLVAVLLGVALAMAGLVLARPSSNRTGSIPV